MVSRSSRNPGRARYVPDGRVKTGTWRYLQTTEGSRLERKAQRPSCPAESHPPHVTRDLCRPLPAAGLRRVISAQQAENLALA